MGEGLDNLKDINQRWVATILVAVMVIQSFWTFAGIGHAAASENLNTSNLAKNVVISHFYGGKKDDVLDVYGNDFVELYNPTAEPVSLNDWSIQFADNQKNNWKVAQLGTMTAQIPAFGYYLIALGSNGNVGEQLPQPDATEASFKLDNNNGKLVLLNTTQLLTANDPMADALQQHVVDFVGYNADAYWGSPAPQAGKQNTMQRLVFDPLNPEKSTKEAAFPNRGNNWDTRNNGNDFEKVKGAKARNSSTTSAYVILESNQRLEMQSASSVDPVHNKIVLNAFGGLVKQGPWSSDDFSVLGLPAGFTAEANANGDQIEVTITGDDTGNVVSDSLLTFEIHPGAWDQVHRPTSSLTVYQGSNTVTLAQFTPSNKIVATLDSSSSNIRMNSAKDLNTTIQLNLSAGVPVDGVLDSNAYSVTGLPEGDWSIQAEGRSSDRTITLSISGTSTSAVMNSVMLNVTLMAEAVQDPDCLASEVISVPLLRYSQPLLADENRKHVVENSIIADNTGFNDPATKEYKYGSDAMGANEYTFLRGTHSLFKADLAAGLIPSPNSVIPGWNEKDILTYTQGDAHIQNVGTFNDSTNQMVFSLNDVDSSGIGSFYDDLIRFVTSIYVVKYEKDSSAITNLQDADFRDVSRTFLDTYKDTLIKINSEISPKNTKLTKSNVTPYTKEVMDKVSKVSYEEALQKLLGKRALDGKLNIAGNSDKFEAATDAEKSSLQDAWEAYKLQVRSNFLNLSDDEFDAYFKLKDIVRRIHQGIGSIGVERYNVLIEGASEANTDDILLDVKEQTRDANLSKDAYLKTSVDPDSYLGVLEAMNRSYLIKEVSPFKGDYTDKPFKNKQELEQYLVDAAKAYAYASSRLDKVSDELNYRFEERFVTNIVPIWDDLQNFILNAAEDYSHQVAADFALVKEDMRTGKLIDVSTLDDLSVDQGALTPAFNPAITAYTLNVEQATDSISITAKATDSQATLSAKGEPYANGINQSFGLSVGKNVIPITVQARNGSSKTYSITVVRAGDSTSVPPTSSTPSTPTGGTNGDQTGTNANSGTISVNGESLSLGGVKINVPAGAMESSIVISVNKVSQTLNLFTDSTLKLLGDVYEITASKSGNFSKPVTVTLPFDKNKVDFDKSIVGLYWFNEQAQKWVSLDNMKVDQMNGTVSGTINHFTKFAVLVSDKTVTQAPEGTKNFTDLVGHWASGSIMDLVELGVIQGYPDNSFRPDKKITRAEFVTLIIKALHLQGFADKGFADTTTHWAQDAISTAAGLGIVNGYSDDTFGPDELVTREQMATMVVRAAQIADSDSNISFSDGAEISGWARSALAAAITNGLVNGYPDGTLKPKGNTTRAEAAALIERTIQLTKQFTL
ncbi:Lamin Tail Domain [Paenibacillus sp. 276b]|nr:Lamin Tail Domain [Paenibacillus sp. 276b]